MCGLEMYEEKKIVENDGLPRIWVRKERLLELELLFDAVCAGHARFVDLVHEAICKRKRE